MRVVIDRFEGDTAVVEKDDRTLIDIPRSRIPEGAREGDVLLIEEDSITVDRDETAKRKKAAEEILKDLWKR